MPMKRPVQRKIKLKKPILSKVAKPKVEPKPKIPPQQLMQTVSVTPSETVKPEQPNSPINQNTTEPLTLSETTPEISLPTETLIEDMPPVVERQDRWLLIIGLAVGIIIIGAAVVLGYMYINSPTVETTTSPIPQAVATAEPEITLDRSGFVFEVYNGSGKAGAALKAQQTLENLGYTVIKTGNADKSNYQTTEISIADNLASQAELLQADLQSEFPTASISAGFTPEEESTATAKIIVGKN